MGVLHGRNNSGEQSSITILGESRGEDHRTSGIHDNKKSNNDDEIDGDDTNRVSPCASSSGYSSHSLPDYDDTSFPYTPSQTEHIHQKATSSKSPYFPTSPKKRTKLSCLPFPPLRAPTFGLVQEKLADEPFWLLVATIFLTKTAAKVALPVFWALKRDFPTPEALLDVEDEVVVKRIAHLGLATRRMGRLKKYATGWVERKPVWGKGYWVVGYPGNVVKADGVCLRCLGSEVPFEEVVVKGESETTEKEIPRPKCKHRKHRPSSMWEIGHLAQGAYTLDSWRIFCRDRLRLEGTSCVSTTSTSAATTITSSSMESDAKSITASGATSTTELQPEWKKVLPQDKELRAFLRWKWMREGWEWDPLTGKKTPLGEDMKTAVEEGRVVWCEQSGELRVVVDLKTAQTRSGEGL